MAANDKRPNELLKLRAVYFMPGVVVVVSGITGISSSFTFWDALKHDKVMCEEQENGGVWLITADGVRREVSKLAIAYKVRVPDVMKSSEPIRRNIELEKRA